MCVADFDATAQVKSASEWVVDKLMASQETLTKFVVFAHHKTILDRLQEASRLRVRWCSTDDIDDISDDEKDDIDDIEYVYIKSK